MRHRSYITCIAFLILTRILVAPALLTADDWPTYRHDVRRSAISQEELPMPLGELWQFTATHPPSPAWGDPQPKPIEDQLELPRSRFDDAFQVAAVGDLVYFGSSADGCIYAVDALTGQIRWKYATGGPVRLAPTVWSGKVYVGSDDGKVYCLDASAGERLWIVQAAPAEEMLLGNGKMISRWPVRTGVLVEDGVAYFGAGVFPAEGLYLYAVQAEKGSQLWKNDTYSRGGQSLVSPQGYLLASKERLFVSSTRSMPAVFARKDGAFLFHRYFNWRDIGMFGGTQSVLANDLLFNGIEQLVAVSEENGSLAFTEGVGPSVPSEGARCVVVDAETVYLLTGKEALAANRKAWTAEKKTLDLRRQLKDLQKSLQSNPLLSAAVKALEEKVVAASKEQDGLGDSTRWRVLTPCNASVALTRGALLAGGDGRVVAFDVASGKEVWSSAVDGKARGLAVAGGRLIVSTDRGSIHCFGRAEGGSAPARKVAPAIVDDPYPMDPRLRAFYRSTAESIVVESGVRRGYALILGGGTGCLALELARRTDLVVYMVERDEAKAARARVALNAAGLLGARVVVHCKADYARYFANLIVFEDGFSTGKTSWWQSAVSSWLKPCGGVAFLGSPPGAEPGLLAGEWLDAPGGAASGAPGEWERSQRQALDEWLAELQGAWPPEQLQSLRITTTGPWAKIVRGPLPGAGSWTHQYAEPGNTATSDDQLVRGPIGILWFGEPGPKHMPSRHAANVSPLAVGGRLFTQGENVIMAHDAYNGLLLWEREMPGALRLRMLTGVSNIAASRDSLFVAIGSECHRLDMETGSTVRTFQVPPEKDGSRKGWLYVATSNGLLYGSRGASGLFAFDLGSGDLKWSIDAGNIQVTTACLGDGRFFYVDRSVTDKQRDAGMKDVSHETRIDRLGKPIPPDVRLVVALDAATGEKRWELPQYVSDCVGVGSPGGELTAMYSKGVLLLSGQPWNGHFWKEFFAGEFSRRSLIALAGDDGKVLWSGRKGYRSRPIIVGDRILAEPWAYELKTGADVMRTHPVTGLESRWQMARPGHHCGCIAAAPNALFFRSGVTAYYDVLGDYGTAHFGAQRPGCWINCIPANGVVMMPEASSGCVCPFSIHCTIVFEPRQTNRAWGMFSAPGPLLPVKHLAVAFGAPGDRRDSKGQLWLAYPRPYTGVTETDRRLVLDLPLVVETTQKGGYFAESADFLSLQGTGDSWIYASGVRGLTRCEVPVGDAGQVTIPRKYTVRLHFRDGDSTRPGQRVFRVALQGQVALESVDIAKETGGGERLLIAEVKGIEAREKLELSLKAVEGEPILSGMEILAE